MSDPSYNPGENSFPGIELNESLHKLREQLAEAVHDTYVAARLKDGWKWGPRRNDRLKTNPTLVPYQQLPEDEKIYDRITADTTLKSILSFGYQIIDPVIEKSNRSAVGEELFEQFKGASPTTRLIHRIWQQRSDWAPKLELSRALAVQALDQGELPLTLEIARHGIKHHPGDPKLTQILALALLQDGHPNEARETLRPLLLKRSLKKLRPDVRVELLAAKGRLYKELWLIGRDPSQLSAAIDGYQSAHAENPSNTFPLINQAALTLLAGRKTEARKLARQTLRLLPDPDNYWDRATVAEAQLILGKLDLARQSYAQAMKLKPSWRPAARTREQARLIAEIVYDDREAMDTAFSKLPTILIYAGHMVDECHSVRIHPRFPGRIEGAVRTKLARALKRLNPAITYGSAACGSDLLLLEETDEHTERNLILPGPADQFIETSVKPAGSTWETRFNRQLERATSSPTQLNRNDPGGGSIAYSFGNEVIIGLAKLRARRLGLDVKALAVWDRQPGLGPGGTSDFVTRCHHNQIPVKIIKPNDGTSPRSSAQAKPASLSGIRTGSGEQVIKAVLMADVKAFSTLHENQIVPFQNQFMRLISLLIDQGRPTPACVNTWGDALYMVFDTVGDAARFALSMRDTLTSFDWPSVGLPSELSIRTALHAGPVFAIVDPVTRAYSFTGTHVTYAARMEPVTEPGQIYVSESYAALLENAGDEREFRTTYIGCKESAKGYGEMVLYRLDRAAQP